MWLQNKNYAKMSLHFRWPKRDETKCYFVSFSRVIIIILQYFCFLCLTSGADSSGLPGLSNKTHPIATQN